MKEIMTAVLVSGGGTNLQALIDQKAAGKLPHVRLGLVVSSGTEWENLMRLYSKRSGDMGIRFVIRENTDEKRDCDLFCGGLTGGEDISDFTILAGEYVSVTVTPKFGLFWGSAIEEAEVYLRAQAGRFPHGDPGHDGEEALAGDPVPSAAGRIELAAPAKTHEKTA